MVMHNFGIDNKLHERGLLPINQPITSPADCQTTERKMQLTMENSYKYLTL